MVAMDTIKVAKDYFVSSQSALLIENRDFGNRKLLSVGLTRTPSGARLVERAIGRKVASRKERAELASPAATDVIAMRSGRNSRILECN